MRAAILMTLLSISASAAQAWDGPGWSPWSLSVQEVRDGISYNSSVKFTRSGKAWRVDASCTAHDPANGAWLTQRGTGIARKSESGLRADVKNLDGFFVNQESVIWGTMLCGSGTYNLGTGD
ncbi:hypothetical protein HPT29_018545 [Microvirga terrae]|uniref:DUF995 domain-containing protein n=1 Tax=Microvirga terrae TaxID=2740529 RepID=A0ABY5RRR8_9HYPH|nr:hypothetical protein [Microvirga terrae]UVF18472.1 hypothetical protein HPT29_018545 [Microvirga terrae]